MTQENKELLLKYLCMALPYGVRVHTDSTPRKMIAMDLWDINSLPKPYLRPMSSMTEEEDNEWRTAWLDALFESANNEYPKSESFIALSHSESIDWLNANHFDYRGLIEKDLAIEVTKENNPYKK